MCEGVGCIGVKEKSVMRSQGINLDAGMGGHRGCNRAMTR